MSKKYKYIVAGDTDSVYVDISPFSQTKKSSKIFPNLDRNGKIDFYDIVCKSIEKKAIQPAFDNMSVNLNFMKSDNLKMKRENIAPGINDNNCCGFWAAKKHYILMVGDSEGVRYDIDHQKTMGMPYIQTTYAKIFRDKMKEVSRILIEKGPKEARKLISEFTKDIHKMNIAELSLVRGVSNVTKYTGSDGMPTKGAGVHIRAAIYYNWLLKHLNIENKYEAIHNGSKIRFIYLKNNPYHFNVMAFIDKMPSEFGLEEFIDYDLTLEKSFLSPMKDIFEAMETEIEESFKDDVDALFA